MKRDDVSALRCADQALELLDMAIEILSRIRPVNAASEKRIHAIQRRIALERNAMLDPLDRAIKRLRALAENPKVHGGEG